MKKYYIKPLLEELYGKEVTFLRQNRGGMMNISYVIRDKSDKDYTLYIPYPKSNELVNRKIEKENIDLAYSLGVTSSNFYFDLDRGIKINEYIPGDSLNKLYTPVDYEKIADLLHKLHSSNKLSNKDYLPFQFLGVLEHNYLSHHKESDEYRHLRDFLISQKKYLENTPIVFAHNDFQKSNIIKTPEEEYFLIDYEFAANNDPIYDIACFGNDCLEDMENLFNAYFSKSTIKEKRRLYLWRIFISLQWGILALIKSKRRSEHKVHDYVAVYNHFMDIAKESKRKYLELKK